jgi:hypothetical protein
LNFKEAGDGLKIKTFRRLPACRASAQAGHIPDIRQEFAMTGSGNPFKPRKVFAGKEKTWRVTFGLTTS